mmetsp:Transcript_51470/g.120775  ORF Transcript_51470/g.120775 Transcript_51470/m.120775 type:complete len:167 (+) Transcript_51470:514-1014(+)
MQFDEQKLVQSHAILRHLARIYSLYGKTRGDMADIDIVAAGLEDFRAKYGALAYNKNYKDHIDEYESETLPQWLGYFERWMKDRASSELHFVGNTMTFVDLLAWDLLDVNLRSFPACLEAFPRLTAFYQTLPTTSTPLAKYIDSAVRKKTPQNGSRAFFDNTVSSA